MPERVFLPMNLTIDRGIEWSEQFELTDADGTAVDLAGHTISASIRTTDHIAGTLLVAMNVEILDEPAGRIRVYLTEAQTGSLTAALEAGWWFLFYNGPSTDYKKAPLYRGVVKVR